MPLYEQYDRYYAATQQEQKLVLHDRDESIQSKLPVADGEVILTQTRLYLATGGRRGAVPNVRLERADPQAIAGEGYLEVASRMGARLESGQTGVQFLKMVEDYRNVALDRRRAARRAADAGIRRRYDQLLDRARAQEQNGDRAKGKLTLRTLHAAAPERPEAAAALGEIYLEEGNARAAVRWLAVARAFDARFDRALAQVESPRLPSRECPAPERWIDRNLTPLLDLPEGEGGPDAAQRARVRAARERIAAFRAARGQATPLGAFSFLLAVLVWIFLLAVAPWLTLGVTAGAAAGVGLLAARRARGRRPAKR